jgi:hypothetical protein
MVTHEQIEEARAGRNISDIPPGDQFYEFTNAFRLQEERRTPGIGEKKQHPLEIKAAERLKLASITEDAEKERKRQDDEAEKDDDEEKDDEFEAEDEDEDDDVTEENAAPRPSGGVGGGYIGLDDETLRALALSGDKDAGEEFRRRQA